MKPSLPLRDLNSSPKERRRRQQRKDEADERKIADRFAHARRELNFLTLVDGAFKTIARGEELGASEAAALEQAWDPKRDAPFPHATSILYELAVAVMNARPDVRSIRGEMFDLMARLYCGTDHGVTALRANVLLALLCPDWRPPWLEGFIDVRLPVKIQAPPGVPSWLSVLGEARGAFLQGVLPKPDMRVGLSRMTSGHPWAVFLVQDELEELQQAAASYEKRKSNALDERPKLPRGAPPWQLAKLPSLTPGALASARKLDKAAPGFDLADDMEAGIIWLSGELADLTVDLPMLVAVSPAVASKSVKHGAGAQVVRGLLARGINDADTVSRLAGVSDTRVAQEKKKRAEQKRRRAK